MLAIARDTVNCLDAVTVNTDVAFNLKNCSSGLAFFALESLLAEETQGANSRVIPMMKTRHVVP